MPAILIFSEISKKLLLNTQYITEPETNVSLQHRRNFKTHPVSSLYVTEMQESVWGGTLMELLWQGFQSPWKHKFLAKLSAQGTQDEGKWFSWIYLSSNVKFVFSADRTSVRARHRAETAGALDTGSGGRLAVLVQVGVCDHAGNYDFMNTPVDWGCPVHQCGLWLPDWQQNWHK